MSSALRVGVDLGGTKIEAVLVDGETIVARRRVATERERGYESIVARAAALVRQVAAEAGLTTLPPVGVGMPGSFTVAAQLERRLVKNSNTTCLNGRPFAADFTRALGVTVAFANDANCFALAEATWGAARGARLVFGVILGTGVGGGIVTDGRVWEGAQGIAGEWGHVVVDPNGPDCYCGRRGCIESYLSGPAIEAAYVAAGGSAATVAEIAARAASEPRARALLDERLAIFGRALAIVINVLDPDVVVLGGGLSNLDMLYTHAAREAVARSVFNDVFTTAVVKNTLGDSAGVLGAALLTR